MARYALIPTFLQAKAVDQALELTNEIDNPSYKDNVLWLIVMFQKRESPLQGLKLVEKMAGPEKKIQAFLNFAREFYKTGNIPVAANAIERVFTTVSSSNLDMNKTGFYSRQLPDIAKLQMHTGNKEGAVQTAHMIPNVFIRYRTILDLAEIQITKGDTQHAQDTLQAVLTDVDSLEPSQGREELLLKMGKVLAQSGKHQEARHALQTTVAMAKTLTSPSQSFRAYHKIAHAQIEIGDIEGSKETMALMRERIPSIYVISNRIRAYQDLFRLESSAGQMNLAQDSLEQAVLLATELQQRPQKKRTLQDLTKFQFEAFGDFDNPDVLELVNHALTKGMVWITRAAVYKSHQESKKANDALEQAVKFGKSLKNIHDQSWLFSEIAKARIESEDIAGALQTVHSIKSPNVRAIIFQEISAEVEDRTLLIKMMTFLRKLPESLKVEAIRNMLKAFSSRVLRNTELTFC